MQPTEHSPSTSDLPPTTTPNDTVEEEVPAEEEVEDVVEPTSGYVNAMKILSKLEPGSSIAVKDYEILKAEYKEMNKRKILLRNKYELLIDRRQYLEENILLTSHVRGFFEPFKLVLECQWMLQKNKVLNDLIDTNTALNGVQDQLIAFVTECINKNVKVFE